MDFSVWGLFECKGMGITVFLATVVKPKAGVVCMSVIKVSL